VPRDYSGRRFHSHNRRDQIQGIVNENPVTVQVYQPMAGGDGLLTSGTRALLATFEGGLVWERVSGRNLEQLTMAGFITPSAFLLVGLLPRDRFGREVVIDQHFEADIGGKTYRITMYVSFGTHFEATLELRK